MYVLINSLTNSFQARAATNPKAEVARESICSIIDTGSSFMSSGTLIFLAISIF